MIKENRFRMENQISAPGHSSTYFISISKMEHRNTEYYVIKKELASDCPRPVSFSGVGVVSGDLTIVPNEYFGRKGVEKYTFWLFILSTPRHGKQKDAFLYFTLGINRFHSITNAHYPPYPYSNIQNSENCEPIWWEKRKLRLHKVFHFNRFPGEGIKEMWWNGNDHLVSNC